MSWALKDEASSEERGGEGSSFELQMSPQTFHPVGGDAKDRQNIVLFTPGNRMRTSEEQLPGKRIFVHREEELTAGAEHGGVKMQTKCRVSPLLIASLLAGALQTM